ncbi:MAG: PilZ domain-containing protein [Thalassobaculum sp.]|uniref:PilZ domain-containing protein n=1 Tax=Thalassobaculum sp. TaxID=2022740 RepID=UPI0032EE86A4
MPSPAAKHRRPSERRRDRRIEAPMTVVIGNTPYAIGDWSLGGARIVDYAGSLTPGDVAQLRVLVPTAGPGALFRTDGRVQRVDAESGSLGLEFEALDTVAFATLNRYFRERVFRGHA